MQESGDICLSIYFDNLMIRRVSYYLTFVRLVSYFNIVFQSTILCSDEEGSIVRSSQTQVEVPLVSQDGGNAQEGAIVY